MEPAIPDFVVIGAMNSGTTTLYRLLQRHSEINMAAVKEPNFFNLGEDKCGTWELGLNWYRGLFYPRPGLKGEITTSYSRFPTTSGVALRIYQINPNAKLIYLVRNPIDRALSHYLQNVLSGAEKRPLNLAFKSVVNSYVLSSMYFLQLRQFLIRFGREQICVLISESMWKDPNTTLATLCSFVNVSNLRLQENLLERGNATGPRLAARRSEIPSGLAQEQLWAALKNGQIEEDADARIIAGALGFTPSDRERLGRKFVDDVHELYRFLGFSVTDWLADFAG
jgi:hypothetical protein